MAWKGGFIHIRKESSEHDLTLLQWLMEFERDDERQGDIPNLSYKVNRIPGAWSHQDLRVPGVLTQPGSQEGQAPVRYREDR